MNTLVEETASLETEQMCCPLRYVLAAQMVEGSERFAVAVRNERTGEQAQVADLTSDRQRAMDFFLKIVRGLVTPVTLREVAEDFVAQ